MTVKLTLCASSSLQGVLGLKKSYFEPRYVLLLPTQLERYTSRLRSRGFYSEAQIEAAVARVDLYASANQQQPDFFDSVITCGAILHFTAAYCEEYTQEQLILHALI